MFLPGKVLPLASCPVIAAMTSLKEWRVLFVSEWCVAAIAPRLLYSIHSKPTHILFQVRGYPAIPALSLYPSARKVTISVV